jgi:DNA-binding XRE family transcriptional regulator
MRTWLKETRESRKLLQKDIARPVGISQAYYTFIENGSRCPSVKIAKKIAAILNFDWTKFFEEDTI